MRQPGNQGGKAPPWFPAPLLPPSHRPDPGRPIGSTAQRTQPREPWRQSAPKVPRDPSFPQPANHRMPNTHAPAAWASATGALHHRRSLTRMRSALEHRPLAAAPPEGGCRDRRHHRNDAAAECPVVNAIVPFVRAPAMMQCALQFGWLRYASNDDVRT